VKNEPAQFLLPFDHRRRSPLPSLQLVVFCTFSAKDHRVTDFVDPFGSFWLSLKLPPSICNSTPKH
jgi:hypothetical protein